MEPLEQGAYAGLKSKGRSMEFLGDNFQGLKNDLKNMKGRGGRYIVFCS